MNGDFETDWRDRFKEFAEERDDDAGIAGWTTTGLEARTRRFLGLWRLSKPDDRWLDAGCGAGTYSRLLRDRGAAVIGADYSEIAVRKAALRSAAGIDYVVADVRRLPFPPATFDGAICFGVTQALSASAQPIAELARLVKPGGVVWIDALNGWCLVHVAGALDRKLAGRRMHLRYDSPMAIRKLMAAAGLQGCRVHWMPIVPTRWQRLQPMLESRLAQFAMRVVPLIGLLSCHAFIVEARKPASQS
ncbi:MAG: class I SAM-dependent methyltransferase [Aromatoleum sp.]|nr:class I SAM-dependent methyltransferase [Aromatoleum sp.]